VTKATLIKLSLSLSLFKRNCQTTENDETQQKTTLYADSWIEITKPLLSAFFSPSA